MGYIHFWDQGSVGVKISLPAGPRVEGDNNTLPAPPDVAWMATAIACTYM